MWLGKRKKKGLTYFCWELGCRRKNNINFYCFIFLCSPTRTIKFGENNLICHFSGIGYQRGSSPPNAKGWFLPQKHCEEWHLLIFLSRSSGKERRRKRKINRKKILKNISFFLCVCIASLKHSEQENFFFRTLSWWLYVEIPLFWGMLVLKRNPDVFADWKFNFPAGNILSTPIFKDKVPGT